MADNYTQTSTEIRCCSSEALDYLVTLLSDNPTDDCAYSPCCAWERTNEHTLWIYSEDYLDSDTLYALLEIWVKKFPLESGYVSYSYSCSKPRLDEFGGAVIAFANGKVKFFDPVFIAEEWIRKQKANDETTE